MYKRHLVAKKANKLDEFGQVRRTKGRRKKAKKKKKRMLDIIFEERERKPRERRPRMKSIEIKLYRYGKNHKLKKYAVDVDDVDFFDGENGIAKVYGQICEIKKIDKRWWII